MLLYTAKRTGLSQNSCPFAFYDTLLFFKHFRFYVFHAEADSAHFIFAKVQNKMHYAVHGHTAAELIYERADAEKPHMGLTTWAAAPEGKVVKSDVNIAKNYLSEQEMRSFERIVSAYLDLAEDRAERHIPMTMEDWSKRLDLFLMADDREVLQDAGKITAEIAKAKAETEFENTVLFRTEYLCRTLISICWN